MFESALHPRVVLAFALAALALSGASASAVAATPAWTADASGGHPSAETDRSVAPADRTTDRNVSATVVHEGDRLVLRAAPNQTIRLRTNATPGTTLQVILRENGNFYTIAEDTVSKDGTAAVAFDLSDFEIGTDVRAVVRHEQTTVGSASGFVAGSDSATGSTDATDVAGTPPSTTTYDESEFPFTSTLETTTTTPATTTSATTAGGSTEGHADDFGVPGFGVPVALVALFGALALARRSRA